MKNGYAVALLMAGLVVALPAWPGLFSSCDNGSDTPKPEWVSSPGYSLPGSYVGIGASHDTDKTFGKQRAASENEAKGHLVQQIEVTIRAENEQTIKVKNNKGVEESASAKVLSTSKEVLRDLKIKGRWVDSDTCAIYTLMVISKASVAQAKRETLMRERLTKMKTSLDEGMDREKIPSPQVRQTHLEDARRMFGVIAFKVINEEHVRADYEQKIAKALSAVSLEVTDAKSRMAVFAIHRDVKVPNRVIAEMLDKVRYGSAQVERLMEDCVKPSDCISKAKEHGYGMLGLLEVEAEVEGSNMGAQKGTIEVSKTIYDVNSGKVLSGPVRVSAQVIGWGNDELNWTAAANKAMRDLN